MIGDTDGHWNMAGQIEGRGRRAFIQWLRQQAEPQDIRELLDEVQLAKLPEDFLELLVVYGPGEVDLWRQIFADPNIMASSQETELSKGQLRQLARLGQNRRMTPQAAQKFHEMGGAFFCQSESGTQKKLGEKLLTNLLEEGWPMPPGVQDQLLEVATELDTDDWNQYKHSHRRAYQLLIKTPGLTQERLDQLTEQTLDLPPDLLKIVLHHPKAHEKTWEMAVQRIRNTPQKTRDSRSPKQRAIDKIRARYEKGEMTGHQRWMLKDLLEDPRAAQVTMVAETVLWLGEKEHLSQLAKHTEDREILGRTIEQMIEQESARWVTKWLQNSCPDSVKNRIPRHSLQPLLTHEKQSIREAVIRMLGRQTNQASTPAPPQTR